MCTPNCTCSSHMHTYTHTESYTFTYTQTINHTTFRLAIWTVCFFLEIWILYKKIKWEINKIFFDSFRVWLFFRVLSDAKLNKWINEHICKCKDGFGKERRKECEISFDSDRCNLEKYCWGVNTYLMYLCNATAPGFVFVF